MSEKSAKRFGLFLVVAIATFCITQGLDGYHQSPAWRAERLQIKK
jgi:hypothetical protein